MQIVHFLLTGSCMHTNTTRTAYMVRVRDLCLGLGFVLGLCYGLGKGLQCMHTASSMQSWHTVHWMHCLHTAFTACIQYAA